MAVNGVAWRWNDDGSVKLVRWSPDEPLDNIARAMIDIGYSPDTVVSLSNVSEGTIAKARDSRSTKLRKLRSGASGGSLPWRHGGNALI
jgi:hypothetical protein